MLTPSGSAERTVWRIPRRSSTAGATALAAPFAQSITTSWPKRLAARDDSDEVLGIGLERVRVRLERAEPGSGEDAALAPRWLAVRRARPFAGASRPSRRSSSSWMAISSSVGELGAAGPEQLDAVVAEGVVRGRDHRGRDPAVGREPGEARASG